MGGKTCKLFWSIAVYFRQSTGIVGEMVLKGFANYLTLDHYGYLLKTVIAEYK